MNAFHDIATLAAGSNWHHDGIWWFPVGLLWVVLIGMSIWLVARNAGHRKPSATEILAERYARGELSSEEYRDRLDELRRNG
jgi:putative membrane protein